MKLSLTWLYPYKNIYISTSCERRAVKCSCFTSSSQRKQSFRGLERADTVYQLCSRSQHETECCPQRVHILINKHICNLTSCSPPTHTHLDCTLSMHLMHIQCGLPMCTHPHTLIKTPLLTQQTWSQTWEINDLGGRMNILHYMSCARQWIQVLSVKAQRKHCGVVMKCKNMLPPLKLEWN